MAGSRHHISYLREAVQALRGPRAAATGGQGDAQLFEESHDVTPGGVGIFQGCHLEFLLENSPKIDENLGTKQEVWVISGILCGVHRSKTYRDALCRFQMI